MAVVTSLLLAGRQSAKLHSVFFAPGAVAVLSVVEEEWEAIINIPIRVCLFVWLCLCGCVSVSLGALSLYLYCLGGCDFIERDIAVPEAFRITTLGGSIPTQYMIDSLCVGSCSYFESAGSVGQLRGVLKHHEKGTPRPTFVGG